MKLNDHLPGEKITVQVKAATAFKTYCGPGTGKVNDKCYTCRGPNGNYYTFVTASQDIQDQIKLGETFELTGKVQILTRNKNGWEYELINVKIKNIERDEETNGNVKKRSKHKKNDSHVQE